MALEDDLDAMVREADALCERKDWDGLVSLRARCLAAVERGHQHWPIASLVEYRLAFLGPPELAVEQLDEGRGHFALGPLTEVVASSHTWSELEPHLTPGPQAAVVAHERSLRGDEVDTPWAAQHLEIVLALQPWEPPYALPTYTWDSVESPRPEPGRGTFGGPAIGDAPPTSDVSALDASIALRDVAAAWQRESSASVRTVTVDGDAPAACVALGLAGSSLFATCARDVLADLAWVGSLAGLHGRRRGAAAGRVAAWWAVANLAGLEQDWPVHPDDLGDALNDLRWYTVQPATPLGGWDLLLAIEDPDNQLAWAMLLEQPLGPDVSE